MKKTTCYEVTIAGFPIRLIQTGIDRFTVQYGLQVKKGLAYGEAAYELGGCIMHALACEEKLDNREKGER